MNRDQNFAIGQTCPQPFDRRPSMDSSQSRAICRRGVIVGLFSLGFKRSGQSHVGGVLDWRRRASMRSRPPPGSIHFSNSNKWSLNTVTDTFKIPTAPLSLLTKRLPRLEQGGKSASRPATARLSPPGSSLRCRRRPPRPPSDGYRGTAEGLVVLRCPMVWFLFWRADQAEMGAYSEKTSYSDGNRWFS